MKKRTISIIILIAYIAILIKVMVFKDIPTIRVGQLMLNFGGADGGHPANFIPFTTIVPYLFGFKGWIIAGINLVGNIILLVPIGFLATLVYQDMTWKKSLILGIVSGFCIEILQTILHVGIFDIDDVILNALGVMIGYWAFILLMKWVRSRNYKNIIITAVLVIIVAVAALSIIYPWGHSVVDPSMGSEQENVSKIGDLCGGTGGTGQITSKENGTFTIKSREGVVQTIKLTQHTDIRNSTGSISESDLKIGDHVTLVGGPNSNGSFTADVVLVCTVK